MMDFFTTTLFTAEFWQAVPQVLWPLCRLLLSMMVALFAANMLEALNWTHTMARLAAPFVRWGHLRGVAGASFSMAFVSPAAANALLADAYEAKKISRQELLLANLFNSTPTYLVHLPTLFSLVFAFLGATAFVYVGLTLLAALLRSTGTMLCARLLLPLPEQELDAATLEKTPFSWEKAFATSAKRFRRRIMKLIFFTVPCYLAVYAMQKAGWFTLAEQFMADHVSFLPVIRPEAFGIVALYLAAESGAAMSAAASLAHTGALSSPEIILALMVGNIISSPMRAFRHQFPSYAGFFAPGLALQLVIANQALRAVSLAVVTAGYAWYVF